MSVRTSRNSPHGSNGAYAHARNPIPAQSLATPLATLTIAPMRLLPLILLLPAAWLTAAEPQYPLWDGSESVADYAKKANLPPTTTLDLDGGVKLELVTEGLRSSTRLRQYQHDVHCIGNHNFVVRFTLGMSFRKLEGL